MHLQRANQANWYLGQPLKQFSIGCMKKPKSTKKVTSLHREWCYEQFLKIVARRSITHPFLRFVWYGDISPHRNLNDICMPSMESALESSAMPSAVWGNPSARGRQPRRNARKSIPRNRCRVMWTYKSYKTREVTYTQRSWDLLHTSPVR